MEQAESVSVLMLQALILHNRAYAIDNRYQTQEIPISYNYCFVCQLHLHKNAKMGCSDSWVVRTVGLLWSDYYAITLKQKQTTFLHLQLV